MGLEFPNEYGLDVTVCVYNNGLTICTDPDDHLDLLWIVKPGHPSDTPPKIQSPSLSQADHH